MERLVARVLGIFAAGFALMAVVVAAYDTGCGSLFGSNSCEKHNSSQVIAVIVLVGLAVTSAVAAYEARGARPRPPEDPPMVYPGGAQV